MKSSHKDGVLENVQVDVCAKILLVPVEIGQYVNITLPPSIGHKSGKTLLFCFGYVWTGKQTDGLAPTD